MAKAASFVSSLKEKYISLDLSKSTIRPHFNIDVLLFQRWAYRIPKGWYGFSLSPAPNSWATIINEFLEWLEKEAEDFKIHQIKLKFGGLRFYVDLAMNPEDYDFPEEAKKDIERINKEISELEEWLEHESLIY